MKHFLVEGSSLLVKAQITERKFKNGQLDIRISSIMLLSEALERNTKEILLKMPLTFVNEEFVNTLDQVVKKATGNCKLKFQVTDPETKTDVTLPAAKLTVSPAVFLKGIEGLKGVEYKLS